MEPKQRETQRGGFVDLGEEMGFDRRRGAMEETIEVRLRWPRVENHDFGEREIKGLLSNSKKQGKTEGKLKKTKEKNNGGLRKREIIAISLNKWNKIKMLE